MDAQTLRPHSLLVVRARVAAAPEGKRESWPGGFGEGRSHTQQNSSKLVTGSIAVSEIVEKPLYNS